MSMRSYHLLVILLFGGTLGHSQTLTDGPTVATNGDGRLKLFARASDGSPWHAWQTSPGGSWTGWNPLGGAITGAPAATVNADGRLEIFGMAGGGVYHNYQTSPGGGWSGWIFIGGSISNPPTVEMNFDGRLELFARGTDGAGWHASQVIPGGSVWTAWTSLGGGIAGSPSVIQNADGRLEIFARGTDNNAYHAWQGTPGGQWTGWNALTGTSIATTPTATINNDGRVEIFAQGTDNAGWHIWQTAPGGAWGSWSSLGGIITGSPTADLDGTGNINIFAINPNGSPFYNTQANGWATWTFLGGAIMYAPSIAMNFDGRQEIFGLTGAGVYHNWQLAPGGSWSGWTLLTTPSNSGDTNGADVTYFSTSDELDADFAVAQGTCQGKKQAGWLNIPSSWPCGARVNISIVGYHQKGLKWAHKAVDGWNGQLEAYYQQYQLIPVQLYISGGGPQMMVVHPVKDSDIQEFDPNTGVQLTHNRALTVSTGQDAKGRRLNVDTSIIQNMSNQEALTTTLAHELGHTFCLDDCNGCGAPVNQPPFPYHIASWSVMDNNEPIPPKSNGWDYDAKNFTEGLHAPATCDLLQISSHLPDYTSCGMAGNAPPQPTCTNGTAVGFLDTGQTSQYTCNGTACDGCNSACSNFAPQDCPTGNGSGGTCSQWCGNVCMDHATCSCPGESPSCVENSGGWFPSCNNSCSPIVVDAFDEGFHFTDMGHGVKFRVAPDGPLLQMSWPDQAHRNGWLALDRNGNGKIDDFTELFGNMTPQPSSDDPNGYQALAIFDDPMNGGNGNGVIDPGDAVYDHLQLWIDANHNGISEPDELHTLAEMGIFRIDLKYHLSKYVDANGNIFRYKSRIWDEAGHAHEVCYDVFLSVEPIQVTGGH